MSLNEQFDELARQKLEERAFPFDEGAWLSAQQSIAAQRRKRKGAWYLLGLIPLAFITWLLWPANEQASSIADANVSVTATAPTENKTEDKAPLQVETETSLAAEALTPSTGSLTLADEAIVPQNTSTPVETATTSTTKSNSSAPRQSRAAASQPMVQKPVAATPTTTFTVETHHTPVDDQSHGQVADGTSEHATGTLSEEPEPAHSTDEATAGNEPSTDATTDEPVSDFAAVATPSFEPEAHDAAVPAQSTVTDALIDAPASILDAQPTAITVAADEPAISGDALPKDSATAEVPVPLPPPLITARSPWEISMLFGAQRTMSRITSDRYDDLDVSSDDALAFGAELMHMGRNVGFGFGVHHTSYNDRFTTPEQRTTAWEVTRNWYLQSIDTTILIITGTDTVNEQIIHTGFNVNTTVQVLRYSFDTTAIVSVRSPRAFSVRTSYLEVPLLFDAHIVQGRWSFGVRGGPSIGLLTARSGSLPSENDETDVPLREAAVQQWSLGWSARAYARYRFNSAWSVGIEPMARGQLMDAISGPVIARRSNAFGALLSLSYKLR
ncbi:MAG: hypothetical protein IPJ85_08940 [Flavobacteriales bacterium]|nr:hypothetical protein [Flavobacteriales bacterium]